MQPEIEVVTPLVSCVFRIDDATAGDSLKDHYLYRYRGQMINEDSAAAYDELSEALKPQNVMPLFRIEEERHVVYIVSGINEPVATNATLNIVMFLLTAFSVMLMGALYGYEGPMPTTFTGQIMTAITNLWRGWPFALSFLSILLAHEFGHYFASRFHKSSASLPYFLPMPFVSPFGTMGAVIVLKQHIKNRRTLLDIGIAGPLAGLCVAIPVLIYGLATSPLGTVPAASSLEGNSLIYLFLKYIIHGQLLPAPLSYDGLSPILYWLRFFFTTAPVPVGGLDVQLNQVAWAGWGGLLITSMNLVPMGQLDGGHIVSALFGRKVSKTFPYFLGILALLGLLWPGWWLWVVLMLFLGRTYDAPLDQITQLDTPRRILAMIGIIIFILVFIPAPLSI
jgi:membrane-associated protease RseP (regulator of RpoE activity)